MSGKPFPELSMPLSLELEKSSGCCNNGIVLNSYVDDAHLNKDNTNGTILKSNIGNENLDKNIRAHSCLKPESLKEVDAVNNGTNNATSEIEYIESENLTDLPSLEASLNTLIERLNSKDWVLIRESLNNVRQISIYHKDRLVGILDSVLMLLVKCIKNPRSAVCKTAIMASADIFKAYGDGIIDSFDPLLVQLLLKSSQDKRFLCEAADKALLSLTSWVTPSLLLPKLQPYLKHKNPRIRAKASICFSRSVSRLGVDGIKSYGLDNLIQIAASQLRDQLPESREAARMLAVELQTAYEKSCMQLPEELEQPALMHTWEEFCNSKLSPLSAQAILRVTSIAKEGLVASC